MPDFGIFRGFNDKLFGDKLYAGQLPTQLGLIGSEDISLLLLDFYPNAAAAYSLRKLRKAYTGGAIEVRRTNNDVADIGFTSTGDLDTAALIAFTGTGALDNGFVTKWYDQSGNANNATQSTALSQPQIVSAGSVILDNNKPAIDFNGNQGLLTTSALPSFVESSNFTVLNRDSNILLRYFGNSLVPNGGAYDLTVEYGIRVRGGFKIFTDANLIQHLVNFVVPSDSTTSTDTLLYINGVSQTSTSSQVESINFASNNYLIGGTYTTNVNFSYDGKMQELVHYTTDQSSNRTGIEDNINDFYSIY
jgi:hypothetical protein